MFYRVLKTTQQKQRCFQNPVEDLRWSFLRKKVKNFQPLTTFAKSSVLDVRLSSENTYEKSAPSLTQEKQALIYIDSI